MNLVDPGTLKTFLAKHGVSATKGLGQHFLCSKSAVDSIVSTVAHCRGIMEIGPGPGVLTSRLAELSEDLIAIELDARMVAALGESAQKARIVQADALTVDLRELLRDLPQPRALVSNMPYYITGPLLTRFAEVRDEFEVAALMMQREVADRVLAQPGDRDRGSLSVFLQSLFQIRVVAQVAAGCFYPPPKVDSTVLELQPNQEQFSEGYFRLVRLSFAQPRKTLSNNLVAGLAIDRDAAIDAIVGIGVDERTRPQMLTIEQWRKLAVVLEP